MNGIRGKMTPSENDEILQELREQTKWLRLLGFQALKPALLAVLQSDKQRGVYEHSDGKRTVREVAALAGVGPATVSRLWNEWLAAGLCTESPQRPGRAQHLAPLSRLGIELTASPALNGAVKTAAVNGTPKTGSATEAGDVSDE